MAGPLWANSNTVIKNSIFWDNSYDLEEYYFGSTQPPLTNCNVEINPGDENGNISSNPLFVDPDNDNFNLQLNSPCIDAGIEIEGMEYFGSAPDMGAFEYTSESIEVILGDINFDQDINILDIVLLLNYIIGNAEFSNEQLVAADYTGDAIINILDIVTLVNFIISQ